jgi:hypothetical protein
MSSYYRVRNTLILMAILTVFAASYDVARTFYFPRLIAPEQSSAVIPVVIPKNESRERQLSSDLSKEMDGGVWKVAIVLPAPQLQSPDHDAVWSQIFSDKGALFSLSKRAEWSKYVYSIDNIPRGAEKDITVPCEHAEKGYGELTLYDASNKADLRIVYSNVFPYHGRSGEYPEDWTTSQVLSREIAVTVHRWREQSKK